MKQGEVEKIMQEVISYVENLAYGRSENKECAILTGTHKHTYKGHFINHFQTSLVWFWANDGEWRLQRGLLGDKTLSKSKAVKSFQHAFERSLEIFYLEEVHTQVIDLDLFLEEALNGKGYELLLPEELHIKVDSVAPQIVLLAEMIYDYMVEKGYWDIPGSAGLYAYFCAASDLAKQFLIEQNISTHLKKQKMKNLFLSVRYDVAKIIKNRLLPLCRSIK